MSKRLRNACVKALVVPSVLLLSFTAARNACAIPIFAQPQENIFKSGLMDRETLLPEVGAKGHERENGWGSWTFSGSPAFSGHDDGRFVVRYPDPAEFSFLKEHRHGFGDHDRWGERHHPPRPRDCDPIPAPEPASALLTAIGLGALGLWHRKNKGNQKNLG